MKRTFKRGDYFAWRQYVIAKQDRRMRRIEKAIAFVFASILIAACLAFEYARLIGLL